MTNASDNETESRNKVSFVKDIQLMMYGLGDSSRVLDSTAKLVETIVLEQMYRIVSQAEDVAAMRGETCIGPEDILFLMRKNIPGLKRMITYLAIKDEKPLLSKALSELVDIGLEDKLAAQEEHIPVQWKKARKMYCLEFLKSLGIDEAALDTIEDSVKENRQLRASNKSLTLTLAAYQEFHMARCASFSSANQMCSPKFLDWLKLGGITATLKTPVAEVLVYLAKETVACLVDMALTLREENSVSMIDRFQVTTEPIPITPSEILEVIRSCSFQQILPFACFSKDLPRTADRKIIAI